MAVATAPSTNTSPKRQRVNHAAPDSALRAELTKIVELRRTYRRQLAHTKAKLEEAKAALHKTPEYAAYKNARGDRRLAAQDLAEILDKVDAMEDELVTGRTGLPLLDAATQKG